MTTTPTTAYNDLILVLRDLGIALVPATASQWEAPPGSAGTPPGEIPNPTLDTVINPRRMALSEEIKSTTRSLTAAATLLAPHVQTLTSAVRRWEGAEEATA